MDNRLGAAPAAHDVALLRRDAMRSRSGKKNLAVTIHAAVRLCYASVIRIRVGDSCIEQ